MFSHIMLDLETLDTCPSAVVTSIGAVAFDPYVSGPAGLGDKFYAELIDDLSTQQRAGRTISGDTVVWWMRQGQAAQQLFSPTVGTAADARYQTVEALENFADFINANGARDVQLWGNGADFDNIILGSLYEDLGMKKPWSYSRNRCFRTMRNLPCAGHFSRQGTHHNALDDAFTQVQHLQAIYQRLYPQ